MRDRVGHYFRGRSGLAFSGEQTRQTEVVGFSIRIKINSGLEGPSGPVWVLRVLITLSQTRVPKGLAPGLPGRQRHCQLELAPGHFGNSRTGQPARGLSVQSEVRRCQ